MRTKTKVLVCLAAVCVVLSLFFWPEKEPDAYSSATIEAAEEVSRAETEMLAPDERLYGEDGDVRLQDLYNQKTGLSLFLGRLERRQPEELSPSGRDVSEVWSGRYLCRRAYRSRC